MKTIRQLKEIKKPGKYRKDDYAPIIVIDEELDEGYVVAVNNRWLLKGNNCKIFKTIPGAVRHLEQLAVDGADDMAFWIDGIYTGGRKLSASFYPKGKKL